MKRRRPPRIYWIVVVAAILLYQDSVFFPRPPWHEVVRWLAVALILGSLAVMIRSRRSGCSPSSGTGAP